MAVVFALMIVGWLLAFALGSQAGFDAQSEPTQSDSSESAPSAYREPASVA